MTLLYTTATMLAMYTIATGDWVTAGVAWSWAPNFLGKFFACVNYELPRFLTAWAVHAGDISVNSHPSPGELVAALKCTYAKFICTYAKY